MKGNILISIPDGAGSAETEKNFKAWLSDCPKGVDLSVRLKSENIWYTDDSIVNSNGDEAFMGDYVEMECKARDTLCRGRILEIIAEGTWKRVIIGSVGYSLDSIIDFKILKKRQDND